MPKKHRLSPKLLEKLAARIHKSPKYMREQISKQASKKNVSSEAYLVYWAKKEGIASTRYMNTLDASAREEVRALSGLFPAPSYSRSFTRRQSEWSRNKPKPATWRTDLWVQIVAGTVAGTVVLIIGIYIFKRLS